jgi:hypothetical protein
MSMSIVNGYACTDCADIAKAKRGEDPNAKDPAGAGKPGKPPGSPPDPAVVLGGSLASRGAPPSGQDRGPGPGPGPDTGDAGPPPPPPPPRKGALVDIAA